MRHINDMTEDEALRNVGIDPQQWRDARQGECPDAVAGFPWEWGEHVRDAVRYRCHDCGVDVAIAPSSSEVLARCPQAMVLCVQCTYWRKKADDQSN